MPKQKNQIAYLLTNDSFVRWINGEASRAEQQKWDQWLEEKPANIYIVKQAQELNQSLQFEEEYPDTSVQFNRLEDALNNKQMCKQMVWPIRRSKNYWLRVAVVGVLVVAVLAVAKYAGWRFDQQKKEVTTTFETVQTDYGEVKKLKFSDGSEITLNAHSKLIYPRIYKEGDMEVKLWGEAYFSIARKSGTKQRTFSVHTPEARVVVLGTKFNVNTNSKNTEVVLEEGQIHLEVVDSSGMTHHNYMMKPGELARLKANNAGIEIKKVNTELYTAWTKFEMKLKNTPLRKIAERVEQTYGIDVEFKNERLKEIEFSGSAPNENLPVLLEGLRTLLNISIVHQENKITFGG